MEDNGNVVESSGNENPLEIFVADLDLNLDAEVRIQSIKKLPTVALALGVDKTKTDLIPYLNNLTEGIYNDDEILMNLAEQLQNLLPYVGGPENVSLILNILEKLSEVEEAVVREKAIESLDEICKQLDDESVENDFVPLVFRLMESDWFTSKCSAAALCSICYPRVNYNTKVQLRNVYKILCQSDVPLVRRAAAAKLGNFIKCLELEYINEFITVYETFAKDDQDSVRLLAIDVGISISLRLSAKEIEELMVTSLMELYGDPSWRVRYQAANQLTSLQNALGHELTHKYLVPIYQNLVYDSEPQIRELSANSIVRFCETLQKTYKENDGKDELNPVILNQIFPLINILDQDCNNDVKQALSSVITSLCPLLGRDNTKLFLLPLITDSLVNDSSKVKENIISNLNNIISVIGIEEIADTVLRIIVDLITGSVSIWRTRRNLIVTINYMATSSGKEYFDDHLKPLYQKLLNDGVYAVRKTAPLILPVLVKKFGFKWAESSILNDILLLANHSHYLYRYVCLFCIDELVSPALEIMFKNNATIEPNHLRYLAHIYNSEHNNEKNLDFVNRIKTLNDDLQTKFKEDWVCDVLTHLHSNDIPDDKIERYAEETIKVFLKGSDINITSVTLDEIKNEDVYLEGLLDVVINKFMKVLCQLSMDKVDNVQSLVGKTIVKIETFSNALDKELKELLLLYNQNEKKSDETDKVEEDIVKKENILKEEYKVDDPKTEEENIANKSMENELLEILDQKLMSIE